MKLASRAALDAAKAGDTEKLDAAAVAAQKAIDKAAQGGTIHKKKAARRKSRLMKRLNAMTPGEETEAAEQAEAEEDTEAAEE